MRYSIKTILMKKKLTLGTAVLALLLTACYTTKPKSSSNATTTADIKGITFTKDVLPLVNAKCSGSYCHHGSPSEWANYDRLAEVVKNGSFEREVFQKKSMPEIGSLTSKEMETLKSWIKGGYPR